MLVGKFPKPSTRKGAVSMANRKRAITLRVPVIEAERTLIEQKMELIPTTNFAAYARKMLIDGYIIQVDHTDIKAMTAEIQKIGVNVNPHQMPDAPRYDVAAALYVAVLSFCCSKCSGDSLRHTRFFCDNKFHRLSSFDCYIVVFAV